LTDSARRKCFTLSSSRNPVIAIICASTNAIPLYHPSL
jgi:hypothetical protein